MDRQWEVLHSPFDIETHKATFVNYTEVVILPDGTIEYAVPSHQMKLERIYEETKHASAWDDCPPNKHFDFLEWLMQETGCICVWFTGWQGKPNAKQRASILKLCENGLMSRRCQ